MYENSTPGQDRSDSPLIEIIDATLWRGSTPVFDGLNLTIERRESVAIIGPNGSGKTTLAKLIMREIYPVIKAGSVVRILGKRRFNVRDFHLRIGRVNDTAFDLMPPDTTVLAACVSAFTASAGLRGVKFELPSGANKASERALAFVGIPGLETRSISSLSTGQRRRAMLARAICHEPDAIVLDEPSSGLDIEAASSLCKTLGSLASQGTSVILVTHLINEIPPQISRVIALAEGRVVGDGHPRDIFTDRFISDLYGCPLRVFEHDGYFVTIPND